MSSRPFFLLPLCFVSALALNAYAALDPTGVYQDYLEKLDAATPPVAAMATAAAIIAAASAVVTGMAAARAMAAAGAVTAPMCLSAPTPRAMPRMLPLWHPSAPSVWMTSRI